MYSGSLSDLDSNYFALSYAWGSNEKPRHIFIFAPACDSSYFFFNCNITESLWQALVDLRTVSAKKHLDIWADALCINQADIPEKNIQVAQTRGVYKGAFQTLAYLGSRTPGFDAVPAYIDCLRSWPGRIARPRAPDGRYFMRLVPEHGIVRANAPPAHMALQIVSLGLRHFIASTIIRRIVPQRVAPALAIGFTVCEAWYLFHELVLPSAAFQNTTLFTKQQLIARFSEIFIKP